MSNPNSYRPWLLICVALMVGLFPFFLPRGSVYADPGPDLEQLALERVATLTGRLPAELRVVQSAVATYPLQGRTTVAFKIEDVPSTRTYGVMLDANGEELDPEQLAATERELYTIEYGRFDPVLVEHLTHATPGEPIAVSIWLKEPAYEAPERPLPVSADAATARQAEVDTFLASVSQQRATAVNEIIAPIVARLAVLGTPVMTDTHAPVIFATLSPATLRRVAEWEEVDRIYLSGENQAEMAIARSATAADWVQALGTTGAGVKVAQIDEGGRVAPNNPFLAGVVQDTTYVCNTATPHSTGVAGVIRSTDTIHRGIAPGVTLWAGGSCSQVTSEFLNRSTAAATWGASAINLSWGNDSNRFLNDRDRFYDDYVLNRYITVVKSAGNQGMIDDDITSPGLAYNVITVGAYDDHNTVRWGDDTMLNLSSAGDPRSTHSDREKPEVAAPGSGIDSTTTFAPWTGGNYSGTSIAAPQVTGGAALLMQVNSGLRAWPEGIKAILMAGAYNNIEGSARLSEEDGAGGIDLLSSAVMAEGYGVRGDWGGHFYSCATSTPPFMYVSTMTLTAGERTRVAIAWLTNDDYFDYYNRPDADLDLVIVGPTGGIVTGSNSFDNTYEIVDFIPPTSGVYQIRVNKYRCDRSGWLGYAWHRGSGTVSE